MSILAGGESAQIIDREAQSLWFMNSFSLVEAAGRNCAQALVEACASLGRGHKEVDCTTAPAALCSCQALFGPSRPFPRIVALAGSGNNAADALVMLRALILRYGRVANTAKTAGPTTVENPAMIFSRLPEENEESPRAEAFRCLKKMGLAFYLWDENGENREAGELIRAAEIIIDGIGGTGIKGSLKGNSRNLLQYVDNFIQSGASSGNRGLLVSIDVPSGLNDQWKSGLPVIQADITLAIEPSKLCLYKSRARPYAGRIIPVGEVFPVPLMEGHGDAELLDWREAGSRIPPVRETAYKHERGLVEIHAGSRGAAGAALIAGMGAQAAGAGLIRLVTSGEVYPVLASRLPAGLLVVPEGDPAGEESFHPNAFVLGPGWGKTDEHRSCLEGLLKEEERGTPLIIDADAIHLAKGLSFHGNAVLTPHPGEFAAYTDIPKDEILEDPIPILKTFARDRNITIVLKGHVIYIASPQGRIAVIDGMSPVLAAGGSGDLLAGLCGGIAGRLSAVGDNVAAGGSGAAGGSVPARDSAAVFAFSGYDCAAAAAALLIAASRHPSTARRFGDPSDIAEAAALLAGEAWLPGTFRRVNKHEQRFPSGGTHGG
ncbi:MAG: NAD(P)H-hydrate dehydratase [Treponema sp.]|nr:NAD(P)H-hydrate dehydratase [Treponema sp.]